MVDEKYGYEGDDIACKQQRRKPRTYTNAQGFRDGIQTTVGEKMRSQLLL